MPLHLRGLRKIRNRVTWAQGVRGSNPRAPTNLLLIPTNLLDPRSITSLFLCAVPKLEPTSFAGRFSFASTSRFICSFICEYFLNTFASPCRSSCVTHSSATPPALSRVAYVESPSPDPWRLF
jgi:hypothetical protein